MHGLISSWFMISPCKLHAQTTITCRWSASESQVLTSVFAPPQALGKYNIICIEDLVHEIYSVGPAFKQASNFLWPFKLSAARGGMDKKRLHYIEGGQHGSREHYINNLVRNMN